MDGISRREEILTVVLSSQAISVQLPTWDDTVGWSVREPRIVNALLTGYPRFMIHRTVTSLSEKIAAKCLEGGGFKSQSVDEFFVRLVSTYRHAALGQRNLRHKMEPGVEPSDIAVMKVSWDGTVTRVEGQPEAEAVHPGLGKEPIFAVTYPIELQLPAKFFWQHTGFGISSRRSELWLEQGPFSSQEKKVESPIAAYDSSEVAAARAAVRSRITAGNSAPEENVFLYAGGMAAITQTAMAIQALRDPEQISPCCAAVFGFVVSPSPPCVNIRS